MKATKATKATEVYRKPGRTYTHVGGKLATGYRHRGKDFEHYGPMRPGKVHAMNAATYRKHGWAWRGYAALCGEFVDAYAANSHDQEAPNPVEAVEACDGAGVTCSRCRKVLAAGDK